MFSLKDKTAFVTGGGSGIGQAIAWIFARQGARVWVADIAEAAAAETVRRLSEQGGRGEAVALDVADPAATAALAARLPRMDIVANVAGIGHVGTLLTTTAADLDRVHSVNVRGVFNVCHAFVPAMIAHGAGSVINLASAGGLVGIRDRLAYTASKHAVVGLTRAMALDHSGAGVRFNSICPGRVETPFVKARIAEYPDPERAYREMCSTQLNGRMATPDEIAAAAVYLASDESAMVTGSCLAIDGGFTIGK